jgi:hypothetical protein
MGTVAGDPSCFPCRVPPRAKHVANHQIQSLSADDQWP